MIVMALDHVRDFFHVGAMHFQPEDLTQTTAAIFFTRWITHFCAPVFAFTAGLSAFLWRRRNRTTLQLSRFLWSRGLWLILLEVTVVHAALTLGAGPVILNVLWVLGVSMITLGFLVYLPIPALAALSLATIALHNLAGPVQNASWLRTVLHQQGVSRAGPAIMVVAYPLVPWFAVMSAGFCFGAIVVLDPPRRRRWTFTLGVAATAAFIMLRGLNVYGDPQPWSGHTPEMLVLSFLRCAKYPPSLDFLLMTLGPALLLLAWFDGRQFRSSNPLIIFGRVPLFYFLVHLFAIHALAVLFAFIRYGHAEFMLTPLPSMGGSLKVYPPDFGYNLGVVYAVWIAVVALLYPLCLWFARLRSRRHEWWLSYL